MTLKRQQQWRIRQRSPLLAPLRHRNCRDCMESSEDDEATIVTTVVAMEEQQQQGGLLNYMNDDATATATWFDESSSNNNKRWTTTLFRRFLFILAVVSILLNKLVLCVEFMNFRSITTYLWLPSVFLWDAVFLGIISYGLFYYDRRSSSSSSLSVAVAASVLTVLCVSTTMVVIVFFTALVVTFQVTAALGYHTTMPWRLSWWAVMEWKDFAMIVKAKSTETVVHVWMVALVQISWTTILLLLVSFLSSSASSSWRAVKTRILSSSVVLLLVSGGTATCPPPLMCSTTVNKVKRKRPAAAVVVVAALSCFYVVLVMTLRPNVPYRQLSQTPCIEVPIEILNGIQDYRSHSQVTTAWTTQKHSTTMTLRGGGSSGIRDEQLLLPRTEATTANNRTTTEEEEPPLNVVILFMESVRADMMPFDPSTRWAQRFVPDPKVHDDLTPFYSHWVTSNDTLFIPHIKTASGLTHKSLLSTLCSVHALPIQGTVEPFHPLYHACLPHWLSQYNNYTSIFAQPQTEMFEHQTELIRHIGFPQFFGKETFDNVTQPNDDYRTRHTANYFGYEDNIMLPVLLEWIEDQRNMSVPFFLSYLCGITHDPHNIPPVINWTAKHYSPNERVNDYLNTIACMDEWLKAFLGELEKRHILESTLVVILGDHGGSFYDRDSTFGAFDQKYEEAMTVGISFHSQSPRWRRLLLESRRNAAADITNGTYSSIDVLPTILEVLGIRDSIARNGQNNSSLVDGRSMLHPSGRRLLLSIANPGYTMVLRDRTLVLVRRLYDDPEAFDLKTDPEQKQPLYVVRGNPHAADDNYLASWGEKAVAFLDFVEEDLQYSYNTGQRCQNCTLSYLLSLETLDEWSPEMATSRSSYVYGIGDDAYNQWSFAEANTDDFEKYEEEGQDSNIELNHDEHEGEAKSEEGANQQDD